MHKFQQRNIRSGRVTKVLLACAAIFLSVSEIRAQIRHIYISPLLGAQTPLSKVVNNGFTKGTLVNNRLWPILTYGIEAKYELGHNCYIIISFLNGQSGYSMGIKSNKKCGNGYSGIYSDNYTASSYNDKRLLFRSEVPLSIIKKGASVSSSFSYGIGIDFRSNETDQGIFSLTGINRCGEDFYLEKVIHKRKKTGLVLPLQLNFELQKKLILSFFYHYGLTKHFDFDILYVTDSYIEKSAFKNKGTSYGVSLGYSIKICRGKK
jgi:hypothetical protein